MLSTGSRSHCSSSMSVACLVWSALVCVRLAVGHADPHRDIRCKSAQTHPRSDGTQRARIRRQKREMKKGGLAAPRTLQLFHVLLLLFASSIHCICFASFLLRWSLCNTAAHAVAIASDRARRRQLHSKEKGSKEIDKICMRAKMNEMRQRSRAWRLEKKKETVQQ